MKGLHSRYLQRQTRRNFSRSMDYYTRVLQNVVEQTGDGRSYSQSDVPLNFRLREGVVYGFYCPDNENYYRTILIKTNIFTQERQSLLSNPVWGVIPDGVAQITPDQALKEMKPTNTSSLNTFPHNPLKSNSGGSPHNLDQNHLPDDLSDL